MASPKRAKAKRARNAIYAAEIVERRHRKVLARRPTRVDRGLTEFVPDRRGITLLVGHH